MQAMQPAKADDAVDTDPADPAAWAAGQTSPVGAASESPCPMSVASPGTNPSASGDAEVRDMEGEGHGHNVMGTAQSEAQSPAQAGRQAAQTAATDVIVCNKARTGTLRQSVLATQRACSCDNAGSTNPGHVVNMCTGEATQKSVAAAGTEVGTPACIMTDALACTVVLKDRRLVINAAAAV